MSAEYTPMSYIFTRLCMSDCFFLYLKSECVSISLRYKQTNKQTKKLTNK